MNALTRRTRPSRTTLALLAASLAAAATAAWVARQARRAERDNPPQGRFLYMDGVRLHYVVRGEGPPVVLVHGNTVTRSDFEASGLMDRLARNHCVIAFDRPGFGYSTRPRDRLWTPRAQAALLRRALAALEVEQPVLLGHSMGAMVALAMALDDPELARSLVLVGGYYYPTLRVDALLTAPMALPGVGDAMRYTVSALTARATLGRLVERMFAPNDVPQAFYPALPREMMLRPVQMRAAAQDAAFMMPQARSLAREYSSLHLPVVLVAGTDDKMVDPQAHSGRLHQALSNSELLLVPGCGHMAHYFAQDLLASVVGGAWQGQPASGATSMQDTETPAPRAEPVPAGHA